MSVSVVRRALLATVSIGALTLTGLVAAPGALGQVGIFPQPTDTTIADDSAASPYPSSIAVSGLPKGVTDVDVTFDDLSHQKPADIDVLLVGPTGASVLLMSDAGSSFAINAPGIDLNFDDEAGASLPQLAQISAGSYRPTNYGGLDVMSGPAPAPPVPDTTLAVFDNTDANGVWNLYVLDDAPTGSGLLGGWSLKITTVDTPAAPIISTPTNGLDSDGDFIVAGTAQAGSTVKVYEGTALLNETTTSATGTWALVLLDQEHRVHAYTATATDAFGNVSAPSAVKTIAVDMVRPRVIRTTPAAGADDVRRGRNVRAFFSEPVRPVTIVGANVKLVRVATGATVRARLRYDADTKTVVVNPRRDLAANARYKVVVGTGVRDLAGNRLDQNTAKSGNQAKVWRFTTR